MIRRPTLRLPAAGLALALVLVMAYVGISLYAAATLSTTGTHRPLTASAGSIGTDWEDASFASRVDHITLRGWLFHSSSRSGRSAILLHGFTANRTDPGFDEPAMTRAFLAAGYDTLVFDFRSFGLSDGNGFTIGWKEGRDVLGAYDYMRSRGYDSHRMAVLGVSMGAESMLGVAEQLGDVAALVADSAYASLRPILNLDITRYSGLPGFFNPGIITAGQLLYGLNPDFSPVDHVRDLPRRAFLFLVGASDTFIPIANAYELKSASTNPASRLVVFDGSAHAKEFHDHSTLYLATVFGFIDQEIAASGT